MTWCRTPVLSLLLWYRCLLTVACDCCDSRAASVMVTVKHLIFAKSNFCGYMKMTIGAFYFGVHDIP